MNYNSNVTLEVMVNGRPVKCYKHEGRVFIEARENSEYQLKIRNNNGLRIMAVAAIDGLDVLTGEWATKNGGGYIVNAHDDLVIKGFRKSLDEVGAFKFTHRNKSYAASKGVGNNVGVIAVAIFKEKQYPTYAWPVTTTWDTTNIDCNTINNNINFTNNCKFSPTMSGMTSSKDMLFRCSTSSANYSSINVNFTNDSAPFQAGTAWGTKTKDSVKTVEFIKDSETPFTTFEIFYDFKAGLESLGIKLIPERNVVLPPGFPKDEGRFCTPPPGWKASS